MKRCVLFLFLIFSSLPLLFANDATAERMIIEGPVSKQWREMFTPHPQEKAPLLMKDYILKVLQEKKLKLKKKKIEEVRLVGGANITKTKLVFWGIIGNSKEASPLFFLIDGEEYWYSLVSVDEYKKFRNFENKEECLHFLEQLFPGLIPAPATAIINSAEPGRIKNR